MNNLRFEESVAYFDVSETGSKTGETFMGSFSVKCFLSPLEVLKADRLNRELLGEISPHMASVEVQNMAFALSQLKYRVTSAPAGWKNKEIDGSHLDYNIIISVLNQAIEAEVQYNKKIKERLKKVTDKLTQQIKSGEIQEEDDGGSEIVSTDEVME